MKTEIAKKAQGILTHRLVIGSFFVYIINNHILQVYFPSWITGKLSGFAWLFFAPYAILFLATLLLPEKINVNSKFQTAVFVLVGIIFALIKTNTALNQAFVNTLEKIIRTPAQIIVDPSDSLSLIALAWSFYFWKNYYPTKTRLSFSRNLLFLGIFSIFTLADAAAQDYGITHIETHGDNVIAYSTYFSYISYDGGFTWDEQEGSSGYGYSKPEDLKPLENGLLQAHLSNTSEIEISTDGGETWDVEYQIEPSTQAQRSYYLQNSEGNPYFEQGPFDIKLDKSSGNIIFAMGHEGVLIRQPDAKWVWVNVGTYQRVAPSNFGLLVSILWGEGLLGLASGVLVFSTISLKLFRQKKIWLFFVILGWVGLGTSLVINQPALSGGGYGLTYAIIVVFVALVIPFGLGIQNFGLALVNEKLQKFGIYVGGTFSLFILPYILWLVDIIPAYETAMLIAIASQFIPITIGLIATSSLPKTENPNE